jgi:hypothetical protein
MRKHKAVFLVGKEIVSLSKSHYLLYFYLIFFSFLAGGLPGSAAAQVVTCNGLVATIVGTPGNDTVTGTNGNDVIIGFGGNDIINGGNGHDVICAGDGDDTVNGGNGDDTIFGEAGNDILNGDNGNDRLVGGSGLDTLDGGNGNDVLEGGDDNDTLNGRNGDDLLSGENGNDILTGENGNDTLDGGPGTDTLHGDNGTDTCTTGEILSSCENVSTNQPPTANAGPDQTVPVATTAQLDGTSSSDPEGSALTFTWIITSQPGSSTATLTGATTATPTLPIDAAGSYTIQLTVSDGNLTHTDTVTISTSNSAPVAHAGPDQSGAVGQTLTLDGSNSSDVDGNALTYQWTLLSKPAPSTATLTAATTVNPTLTLDAVGTYTIQLTVSDGSLSSNDTVTLSTLNSPPVAGAGADQSGTVGQVLTLNGSASSDVDGDTLSYQWSLTSQPPGSTVVLNAPTSAMPTLALDKPGTYVAQLIVNDGSVDSAPDTVTLSTLNSKPVADAGEDQLAALASTVTLSGVDSVDVDGDTLSYQWSLVTKPATSTATLTSTTVVNTSFVLDKPGTYVVQLIVNDGTVDSDPDTVTITTQNVKPVADAGEDQAKLVGQTVQLDGSASSDVDGNPLSYTWSFASVPDTSTATLSNTSIVNPTFVPDLPGTYVVQLMVNDGQLDSDPDTATITITVPDTTPPPPADIGKITVGPITNGQVTLTGSVNSVEASAQVTLTNLRSNQTVTVTANADGSFTAQLGVQASDSLSIIVTDSAGNTSPLRTLQLAAVVQLAITSPVQGATISSNRVRVTGTIQGPANTGVVVNGIVALVYNGIFVADNIELVAGQNTLTAIATPFGGQSVQAQVAVTSTAVPVLLDVAASPTSGIAPLDVTFTYQFGSTTSIQSLSMDFDGDGTFDLFTSDPTTALQRTYTTPGLNLARLQVTDQNGTIFEAQVAVVVQDAAAMDVLYTALWTGMNTALLAGDKTTALSFLTVGAQEKYSPVFDALLPHMATIIASYSPLQRVSISETIGEYAIVRVNNGQAYLFLIYFLKDADGVSRLEAM